MSDASPYPQHRDRAHIVIVGGGLVGLTTAWRLQRELSADEAAVTVVELQNYMVYQSLLPELASGMLEPADVVVPLRRVLRDTHVIAGRMTGLDADRDAVTVAPVGSEPVELHYDQLVLAVGSQTKVLPVPGLAEHAVGFTTVPEALFLRDHVLSRLEAGSQARDAQTRRRALTFVVVGGGYSGVEAIGELQAMAQTASRWYPSVTPDDQRWILLEATDRILPMVDDQLADTATRMLEDRGIDIRLGTVMESAEDGVVRLSDGDEFATDTLVWATGIAPNPLVAGLGLPVSDNGAVKVDATLRVLEHTNIWAAGDCAAVPDLVEGGTCPPNAQHGLREGRQLADNLVAVVRGQRPQPFRNRMIGEALTLGRYTGVAQVFGSHVRGVLPWYMRRLYHIGRVPSARRKVQVWVDWSLRLLLGRDVVSLGSLRRPDLPLEEATAAQTDGD
jgi:NADH dehydrogenase